MNRGIRAGMVIFALAVIHARAVAQTAVQELGRCNTAIAKLMVATPLTTKDSAVMAEHLKKQITRQDSAKAIARACATKIDRTALPDSLLGSLIDLYSRARDMSGVPAILRQLINSRTLPAEDRLRGINSSMFSLTHDATTIGVLRRAVAIADSLGTPRARIAQRASLANAMRKYDPLAAYLEARGVLDVAEKLDSASLVGVQSELFNLVYAAGQWAMADSNPMYVAGIVARATSLMKDSPNFMRSMSTDLDRVAMVGSQSIPFESAYWLNMPPGETRRGLIGKVTLVEFTSEWCTACKPTYKPIQALYKELGPQGFEPVFCVPKTGSEDSLITHYKKVFAPYDLEFPIVIAETNKYDRFYSVGAIPHFLIIDRQGIVRDMFLGWDLARAKKRIQALLTEKASHM